MQDIIAICELRRLTRHIFLICHLYCMLTPCHITTFLSPLVDLTTHNSYKLEQLDVSIGQNRNQVALHVDFS